MRIAFVEPLTLELDDTHVQLPICGGGKHCYPASNPRLLAVIIEKPNPDLDPNPNLDVDLDVDLHPKPSPSPNPSLQPHPNPNPNTNQVPLYRDHVIVEQPTDLDRMAARYVRD